MTVTPLKYFDEPHQEYFNMRPEVKLLPVSKKVNLFTTKMHTFSFFPTHAFLSDNQKLYPHMRSQITLKSQIQNT